MTHAMTSVFTAGVHPPTNPKPELVLRLYRDTVSNYPCEAGKTSRDKTILRPMTRIS